MKIQKIAATLVLTGVVFGAQASTQDSGAYLGLQGGTGTSYGVSKPNNTGIWGAYGGYRKDVKQSGIDSVAFEAGYTQGNANQMTQNQYDISVLPRVALGETGMGVIGKVGARYSQSQNARERYSGWSPVVGAGLDYKITPAVTARALFDYATSNAYGIDGASVSTYTAGVDYKF